MTKSLSSPSPKPLPTPPTPLLDWKILVLVTAYNSLSQRVVTHLKDVGFNQISIQLATCDEDMVKAVTEWEPVLVICPFLTKRVPEAIWKNTLTLILHPGPPGDAGPSAIDWALLGDTGSEVDSSKALSDLLAPSVIPAGSPSGVQSRFESIGSIEIPLQRSHWGVTLLQAEEQFDGGPIWAFDQFILPDIVQTTKSSLYQGPVTASAVRTTHIGLCRIFQQTLLTDSSQMKPNPLRQWTEECVSFGHPFAGGHTLERPLMAASSRRIDFNKHAAEDIARIINCGDSQPGATMFLIKSFVFIYDAHLHHDLELIPTALYTARGWHNWKDIPAGTILAQRGGALLFKTLSTENGACAIWITHGRLPKSSKDTALPPKVTLSQVVAQAEPKRLLEVAEWGQGGFGEVVGMWQNVFVRTLNPNGSLAQMVYFDFYNGACSTEDCKLLLEALKWATHRDRGNVKLLCLMGGKYFSNGIALNIIEQAESPGHETWANINAIDDVVEFLLGDTQLERSSFMEGVRPLCEKGIVTVACLSGNAAAGGVALAAACDIVMASASVVLNPAYRAMGLHGSEFHSWSYLKRAGSGELAIKLLRDMLPVSAVGAKKLGLVDIVLGDGFATRDQVDDLARKWIQKLLVSTSKDNKVNSLAEGFACAPWSILPSSEAAGAMSKRAIPLLNVMSETKRLFYSRRTEPPLIHYRNEELSQMLLDCFHPLRSSRYHERRFKFVRKVKTDRTPLRFASHLQSDEMDEEDMDEFDDAPHWILGEEWGWVGLPTPPSLDTSESLRIGLKPDTRKTATLPLKDAIIQDGGGVAKGMGISGLPPLPLMSEGMISKLDGKEVATENTTQIGITTPSMPSTRRDSRLGRPGRLLRGLSDSPVLITKEMMSLDSAAIEATTIRNQRPLVLSSLPGSSLSSSSGKDNHSKTVSANDRSLLKKFVRVFKSPKISHGPYEALSTKQSSVETSETYGNESSEREEGSSSSKVAKVEIKTNTTQIERHEEQPPVSPCLSSSPSSPVHSDPRTPGTPWSPGPFAGPEGGYFRPKVRNEGLTIFDCYYNADDSLGALSGRGGPSLAEKVVASQSLGAESIQAGVVGGH